MKQISVSECNQGVQGVLPGTCRGEFTKINEKEVVGKIQLRPELMAPKDIYMQV